MRQEKIKMNKEELMRKYHYGYQTACKLVESQYVKDLNKEIERLNNKLNAIRKYLKDNEQEYGSLEDNEKIILDILNGDSNE